MQPQVRSRSGSRRAPTSAVHGLVEALRKEIMGKPSGALLGSEAELLQRHAVSAPTLRQAARLLERKQLLSVERGPKGGYYGRRPTSGATARAAALFLRIAGTTRHQVFLASFPLMSRASTLAAESGDARGSETFRATYEALRTLPPNAHGSMIWTNSLAVIGAMIDLAGNPALQLFLKVLYRLGSLKDAEGLFRQEPHCRRLASLTLDLAEAILERDARLAALMVGRWQMLVTHRLEELKDTAELLDLQTARPEDRSITAVERAAETLRNEILRLPPGAFLGAEEELAARLKVSRHTIRQAAILLQHDQLLETRRGMGGGYLGRRPDIEAVVDAAALYLEIYNGGPRDLVVASQCLAIEACRLAAACRDENLRDALRRVVEAYEPVPVDADPEPFLPRVEQRFMETVLQMAGNPPIELFVKSMYRYGATFQTPVRRGRDRAEEWRALRVRLARAILAGDAEASVIIASRPGDRLMNWLNEYEAMSAPPALPGHFMKDMQAT